jgi:DNA-binding transcriptional MocR family regulator
MRAEDTMASSFWQQQLDRRSFVPLYYQLQEALKEQIESGLWKSGDPLPSEPELARRFGVSRVVVRNCHRPRNDTYRRPCPHCSSASRYRRRFHT